MGSNSTQFPTRLQFSQNSTNQMTCARKPLLVHLLCLLLRISNTIFIPISKVPLCMELLSLSELSISCSRSNRHSTYNSSWELFAHNTIYLVFHGIRKPIRHICLGVLSSTIYGVVFHMLRCTTHNLDSLNNCLNVLSI